MTKQKIDIKKAIRNHINISISTIKQIESDLQDDIYAAVELIMKAFSSGHKLLIAGNGGSAADAQHIAAEFVVRLSKEFERPALPAIALSTDSSILTAAGNDFGFNNIFQRQLEGLGCENDLFLAISTSGNSINLIKAVDYARKNKIKTIGLLGNDGGKLKSEVDIYIIVNSTITQHIQEAHLCIYHIICELVEKNFIPQNQN